MNKREDSRKSKSRYGWNVERFDSPGLIKKNLRSLMAPLKLGNRNEEKTNTLEEGEDCEWGKIC